MLQFFQKYRFPFIFCLINIVLGNAYAYSFIRKTVENQYKVDATLSGLPLICFFIFFCFGVIFNNVLVQKLSVIKSYWIGFGLFSVGYLSCFLASNIYMMALGFGVIAGFGIGLLYSNNVISATRWLPNNKGIATGIAVAGFGLSSFFATFIISYCLTNYGLNQMFLITGAFYVVALSLLISQIKEPPKANVSVIAESQNDVKTKDLFKKPIFWSVYANAFMGMFAGIVVIGVAALVFKEKYTLDITTLTWFVATLAIPNFLGRIGYGYLVSIWSIKKTMLFAFATTGIASLLIALGLTFGQPILLWVFLGVILATYGGWFVINPILTNTYFGQKYYSSNFGVMFSGYGVAGLLGMSASSFIKEKIGTYQAGFWSIVAISLIGILLTGLTIKIIAKTEIKVSQPEKKAEIDSENTSLVVVKKKKKKAIVKSKRRF